MFCRYARGAVRETRMGGDRLAGARNRSRGENLIDNEVRGQLAKKKMAKFKKMARAPPFPVPMTLGPPPRGDDTAPPHTGVAAAPAPARLPPVAPRSPPSRPPARAASAAAPLPFSGSGVEKILKARSHLAHGPAFSDFRRPLAALGQAVTRPPLSPLLSWNYSLQGEGPLGSFKMGGQLPFPSHTFPPSSPPAPLPAALGGLLPGAPAQRRRRRPPGRGRKRAAEQRRGRRRAPRNRSRRGGGLCRGHGGRFGAAGGGWEQLWAGRASDDAPGQHPGGVPRRLPAQGGGEVGEGRGLQLLFL